jgi:riboflavin kinase/FMN adenylyltransferase
MRIVHSHRDVPSDARGGVLALGNFDGVHLGHQRVIGEARRVAGTLGAPAGVMTFDPHPRRFFKPDDRKFELTPVASKIRQIGALGVDVLFLMHFDRAFASIPAEAFVTEVLAGGLAARHVVVGYDFVFGRGRTGDTGLLAGLGRDSGLEVTVVDAAKAPNGDVYSSTRIRNHLREGRVVDAARLLGRLWEIEGAVLHGDERGRQIGFPTANVDPGQYVIPAFGVYACWVGLAVDGETDWRKGVVNIGQRPTFAGQGVTVEAHLFDFAGDLYGRTLRVAIAEHIRSEIKFDGIDAIRRQIEADCVKARAVLDAIPAGDLRAPPGPALSAAELA